MGSAAPDPRGRRLLRRSGPAAGGGVDVKREIVLRNDSADLRLLSAEVEAFGSAQQLGEEVVHALRLALEELFANIIRHAYRDLAEHSIRVCLEREADELRVEVRDDGVPFNPLDASPPDTSRPLEDREPGGMGIYLVRHSMDSIEYRRDGDMNVLAMAKGLGG